MTAKVPLFESRTMRRAVAYDRLAAKAARAGQPGDERRHRLMSEHLRGIVQRERARRLARG